MTDASERTAAQIWTSGQPVVLFDGVCNLCNGTVDFLVRRDRNMRLRYAALQSDSGRRLMAFAGLDPMALASIVLIENQGALQQSAAVLRIAALLPAPWRWLCWLAVLPSALRDGVYFWIARNRYRWFGQRDTCRLPTETEKRLFLP